MVRIGVGILRPLWFYKGSRRRRGIWKAAFIGLGLDVGLWRTKTLDPKPFRSGGQDAIWPRTLKPKQP